MPARKGFLKVELKDVLDERIGESHLNLPPKPLDPRDHQAAIEAWRNALKKEGG